MTASAAHYFKMSQPPCPAQTDMGVSLAQISFRFESKFDAIEPEWRELEQAGILTAYQNFDVTRTWFDTIGKDQNVTPLIIFGTQNGKTIIILPLAIHKGVVTTVRGAGEPLIPLWMPLFRADHATGITAENILSGIKEAVKNVDGIDRFSIKHGLFQWAGVNAPLPGNSLRKSANHVHVGDLSPGYEALVSSKRMKRYRKKLRLQIKKYENAGGWDLVRHSPDNTLEPLELFFAQKDARLSDIGAGICFCEASVRDYFKKLGRTGLLTVYSLRVGDKTRAITAGFQNGPHFSMTINSFANDELAPTSPGEFLLHQSVKDLCERGITSFEMGPGDSRYKGVWCPNKEPLYDFDLPVTNLGRLVSCVSSLKASAKRKIKNNDMLWGRYKAFRRAINKMLPQ